MKKILLVSLMGLFLSSCAYFTKNKELKENVQSCKESLTQCQNMNKNQITEQNSKIDKLTSQVTNLESLNKKLVLENTSVKESLNKKEMELVSLSQEFSNVQAITDKQTETIGKYKDLLASQEKEIQSFMKVNISNKNHENHEKLTTSIEKDNMQTSDTENTENIKEVGDK